MCGGFEVNPKIRELGNKIKPGKRAHGIKKI